MSCEGAPGTVRARVSGNSDVGLRRSHNEDSLLVADLSVDAWSGGLAPATRSFDEGETLDLTVGSRGLLLVVADGMGGAQAGEVASSMAVSGIYEAMVRDWGPNGGTWETFAQTLSHAVSRAGAEIHALADRSAKHTGMGTTVTAVGVCAGEICMAQVGDSRAYLVRRDRAVQLTRDQSVVQHLVRTGKLSAAEAQHSRSRNILLQALGTVAEVDVDLSVQVVRRGDHLVICSDGLTGLVGDEEIAAAVTEAADPAAASRQLVDLANARGGHDNITLLVAHFSGEGLASPAHDDSVGYRSANS